MTSAIQLILLSIVLTAGIYDLRCRRIPNWVSFSGILIGIALNTFLFEWAGLRLSLLGCALATAVYMPLYLLRGMGAGDVKLMMAVGALAGPSSWFMIFVVTGIVGGVIALVLLLVRGRLRTTLWNVGFMLHRLAQFKAPYAVKPELDVRTGKGVRLPHGAIIALGTLIVIIMPRLLGKY